MISNLNQKGNSQAKQEGETNYEKISKASTSARQWFGLRNPRIVRVSRSFGGKDRHSKVCTIKGLRDRRIRLSVPTAIQLYDLQERLGLGQPSKVIDWLLEVTKLDIDELPPLQFPGFGQFPQHMLVSHDLISNQSHQPSSIFPFFDANSTSTLMRDVEDSDSVRAKCKGKGIRTNDDDDDDHHHHHQTNQERLGDFSTQIGAQNFLLNNSLSENTSSLSIGGHGLYSSQIEEHHRNDTTFFSPSGSQLFFCPPSTTPTLFTPYPSGVTTRPESERQFNHIQFLGSSFSVVPALHSFPKLLLPHQNSSQEKDNNATGS